MKPLAEQGKGHKIVADEQKLLARVSSALSALNVEQSGAPDYDSALINLRDQIADAKPEDLAPLVEQMSRISAIAQRYGRGRDLPVDPESPYFAHMRLVEDERKRDVLIGKHGFIDRSQNIQIVDWRNAPVSRIYYRYEEGDDYEEAFGTRDVEGLIEARRTVTIDQGKLIRISCPQGLFVSNAEGEWFEDDAGPTHRLSGGQGKALRPPRVRRASKESRLGAESPLRLRADKHLPEIAALIDPVQFDLITQPESGLVVLQGGAGTGKTTVALHRVAYLSFQRPKLFRPQRMLVVVPGEAMLAYISGVLPSLGVEGVNVSTGASWFRRTRQKVVPDAPRVYNADTPIAVLRFKKHPVMLHVVDAFVRGQVSWADKALREAVDGVDRAEEILAEWERLGTSPLAARVQTLKKWLVAQRDLPAVTKHQAEAVLRRLNRRVRDVVSDWSEMLTDFGFLSNVVNDTCSGAFTERDLRQVTAWCSRQTEELPDIPKKGKDDEIDPYLSVDGRDERKVAVAGHLDPPDDGILLYLDLIKWGELMPAGSKKRISFEHVVVDEAQDLTALELKVLIRVAGKRRSVTLAGDTAQRLVFDNALRELGVASFLAGCPP